MQLRLLLREHHYNSNHDSSLIDFAFSFLNLGITLKFNGAFLSENNHSVHIMTTGSLSTSF
uniref:Uncharacterized protein n=1 Tax=Propithecus coquereli TaxID=379532 RepID=A0A2K6F7W5_PROCO